MKREVKFEFIPPAECTEIQLIEWLFYKLGYAAQMSIENPLHEYDLEAIDVNLQ